MKLGTEITVQVGDDGVIALREPTPKEWNKFTAARYPIKRGGRGMSDNSAEARVALFDTVCIRIENIEDESGAAVTLESLEKIPVRLKGNIIFEVFEQRDDVTVQD